MRVFDVTRTGCQAIKDDKLRECAETAHYRLVAEVEKTDEGTIRASVAPMALESGDPFYSLKGAAGGITIRTSAGHEHTILQESPGLDDAAFALVQDCCAIARGDRQT